MMETDASQRTITTPLSAFVADLAAEDVPDAALDVAERSVVDTVGVICAGWEERETAIAGSVFGHESTDLLAEEGDAQAVAFVNGVAGHCLDYDDCWEGGAIHPSVTVISALLAVAEEDTTGGELLAAYVAGVETQGFLAGYLLPEHYEAGWHTTGTLGTFGATAAVANLLDLDAETVASALNLAASFPAGLKRNFGTTTKSVHVGQAARSGITAARLAANGASADDGAIDRERGFLELYGGDPTRGDVHPDELGSAWTVLDPGIQLKKYPCCNFTHSSIEAAIQLRSQHSLDPDAIEAVTVSVSRGAVETVTHADPATPLEAKFSFPYTVAAGLATGTVTLETFDPDAIEDPATQRVRERVAVEVDPDLPYPSLQAEVTVATTGGTESSTVVDGPPGSGSNPLSESELQEKFRRCAGRALEGPALDGLFESLRSLRDQPSTAGLRLG